MARAPLSRRFVLVRARLRLGPVRACVGALVVLAALAGGRPAHAEVTLFLDGFEEAGTWIVSEDLASYLQLYGFRTTVWWGYVEDEPKHLCRGTFEPGEDAFKKRYGVTDCNVFGSLTSERCTGSGLTVAKGVQDGGRTYCVMRCLGFPDEHVVTLQEAADLAYVAAAHTNVCDWFAARCGC